MSTMKKSAALLSLLALAWAGAALAQSTATPVQTGFLSTSGCQYAGQTACFIQYGPGFNASGQTTLTATTTTSNVALPSSGATVVVSNAGTTTAYVALGASTVTSTTATGTPVLAGSTVVLLATPAQTYIAGITATGSDVLTITTGTGVPAAAPASGGSGGVPSSVNVAQVGGTTVVTGGVAGSLGIGGLGAAGTPAGGVVSVQGVSGGIGIPISGATSNASSGVATSAANIPSVSYNYNFNGTTWDQAKTLPGLTTSGVGLPAAGIASAFNTTLPTYTNGQYGALQMSPQGGILIAGVNGTAAISPTALVSPGDATGTGFIGLVSASFNYVYNGSSNDRLRSISGAIAGGTGNVAVSEAPNSAAPAGIAPVTSAASSSLLGKAAAGNLYGWSFTEGATGAFFAILNVAAVPSTSASITPVECIPVAANSFVRVRQDIPDRYGTGVVVVSTSSCTTYTAVTPIQMLVTVE